MVSPRSTAGAGCVTMPSSDPAVSRRRKRKLTGGGLYLGLRATPCARHTPCEMERARRHHRVLAAAAFGLLALVAELLGRSLTHRLDLGRHVESPSYSGADYYPLLLACVKV